MDWFLYKSKLARPRREAPGGHRDDGHLPGWLPMAACWQSTSRRTARRRDNAAPAGVEGSVHHGFRRATVVGALLSCCCLLLALPPATALPRQ